jgi:hypothetical protein
VQQTCNARPGKGVRGPAARLGAVAGAPVGGAAGFCGANAARLGAFNGGVTLPLGSKSPEEPRTSVCPLRVLELMEG